MADILEDIGAYDAMRTQLELAHSGKWVVIYDRKVVDTFDTFDAAAAEAVRRFGRGPYLIRQVSSGPVTLPAAALYRPVHA